MRRYLSGSFILTQTDDGPVWRGGGVGEAEGDLSVLHLGADTWPVGTMVAAFEPQPPEGPDFDDTPIARRLAKLEAVAEKARTLRQEERSLAGPRDRPIKHEEWHAAQRRVREAGEALDESLAALDEEVGRG